jgi:hypothetical protein
MVGIFLRQTGYHNSIYEGYNLSKKYIYEGYNLYQFPVVKLKS